MKVFRYWLLVIWVCGGNAWASTGSTTIGILPFEVQSIGREYSWLSAGISDTLIAKFTGTKGIRVLEREKLAELANVKFSMLNVELKGKESISRSSSMEWVQSRDGGEATENASSSAKATADMEVLNRNPNTENRSQAAKQLALLNAQYLLVGSYTVIGDNIKINARIVHAETAKINGATALAVSGKVSDIFALETELAEEFAKACNLEVAYNKLSYSDGKNTVSYKLFNQGKLLFVQANGDKFQQSSEGADYTSPVQNAGKLREAINLFMASQQQNDGFYFAEAHTWEGKARIALANSTTDQQTKSEIQQDHVSKFEADAAEAAPAFYDLGVALQACGQYEKAIKAYDDYLRWMSENEKSVIWSHSVKDSICGLFPTSEFEYENSAYGENERMNIITTFGDQTLFAARKQLSDTEALLTVFCINKDNGKVYWSYEYKYKGTIKSFMRVAVTQSWKHFHFFLENKNYIIDRLTGQLVAEMNINQLKDGKFTEKYIYCSSDGKNGISGAVQIRGGRSTKQLHLWRWKINESGELVYNKLLESAHLPGRMNGFNNFHCAQKGDVLYVSLEDSNNKKHWRLKKIRLSSGTMEDCWLSESERAIVFTKKMRISKKYFAKRDKNSVILSSIDGGLRLVDTTKNLVARNCYEYKENLYYIRNNILKKISVEDGSLLWSKRVPKGVHLIGISEGGPIISDTHLDELYCINEKQGRLDLVSNVMSKGMEASAYFNSGLCSKEIHRNHEAISRLNSSLTSDPALNKAYYELAVVYDRLPKSKEVVHKMLTAADMYYTTPEDSGVRENFIAGVLLKYGNVKSKCVLSTYSSGSYGKLGVLGEGELLNRKVEEIYLPELDECVKLDSIFGVPKRPNLANYNFMGSQSIYNLQRLQDDTYHIQSYSFGKNSFNYRNKVNLGDNPYLFRAYVKDDVFYYLNKQNSSINVLNAYDMLNGKKIWSVVVDVDASSLSLRHLIIQAYKDKVLLAVNREDAKNNQLFMYSVSNGDLIWKKEVPPNFKYSSSSFYDITGVLFKGRHILYYGLYSGKVLIIDSLSGDHKEYKTELDSVTFRELKEGHTAYAHFSNLKCMCHGRVHYPHKARTKNVDDEYGLFDLVNGTFIKQSPTFARWSKQTWLSESRFVSTGGYSISFYDGKSGIRQKGFLLNRGAHSKIRFATANDTLVMLSDGHTDFSGNQVVKYYEFVAKEIPEAWAQEIRK